MVAHSQFDSPTFKLVVKGLIALHQLIKDGKDDSPEADAIRDSLDAPLGALNRIEKERVQWLSEDLYSVSDPPAATTQKAMNPQAQQQLKEVIEARQSRDWDRALALLRRWGEYISPAHLSYIRGAVWLAAGNPEVAVVFYGHAVESDPTNANYPVIYMDALAQSNPEAAEKPGQEVLADDE